MGIRLHCPNGHKLHVKSFLAGRRGVCPHCGAKFEIPKTGAADVSPDDAGTDEIAVVPSVESPGESLTPGPMAAVEMTAEGASSPPQTSTQQASGEIWYLRHPLHGHFGPTSWETLRRWAAEERVSADSLIWREGWPDWQPAASLLPSLTSTEPAVAAPRQRDPLDLDALAAAGASGLGGHPFGAAAQRMASRRKNAQTMRIVSIVLVAAVTILTCVLLFVLMR